MTAPTPGNSVQSFRQFFRVRTGHRRDHRKLIRLHVSRLALRQEEVEVLDAAAQRRLEGLGEVGVCLVADAIVFNKK